VKIFLDMDGVIVDFVTGAMNHCGKQVDEWPKGEYDLNKVLRVGPSFWKSLDEAFWLGLTKTHDADSIFETLRGFDICILTDPGSTGHNGKYLWLKCHYPNIDYLMGNRKDFCSHKDALLIDDSDKNCLHFRLKGGKSIVWPQQWNSKYWVGNKINYLKKELRRLI